MKINHNANYPECSFAELSVGDAFVSHGKVWIACCEITVPNREHCYSDYNAVCLDTGEFGYFNKGGTDEYDEPDVVLRPNITLTVN